MADALLLIGHGSKNVQDDVLPYYVKYFEASGQFSEVRACYLERDPDIVTSIKKISADRIYVMPLLLAHGHHTQVTIPGALGIQGKRGVVEGREIIYLEPLGKSEHIAFLIRQRIEESR